MEGITVGATFSSFPDLDVALVVDGARNHRVQKSGRIKGGSDQFKTYVCRSAFSKGLDVKCSFRIYAVKKQGLPVTIRSLITAFQRTDCVCEMSDLRFF